MYIYIYDVSYSAYTQTIIFIVQSLTQFLLCTGLQVVFLIEGHVNETKCYTVKNDKYIYYDWFLL